MYFPLGKCARARQSSYFILTYMIDELASYHKAWRESKYSGQAHRLYVTLPCLFSLCSDKSRQPLLATSLFLERSTYHPFLFLESYALEDLNLPESTSIRMKRRKKPSWTILLVLGESIVQATVSYVMRMEELR